MKKLLSLLAFICIACAVKAQTLTIRNNHSCTFYYQVIVGTTSCSGACATPPTAISTGGVDSYTLTSPVFVCSPTRFVRVQVANELTGSASCPILKAIVGDPSCGFHTVDGFINGASCSTCASQTVSAQWIKDSYGNITVVIH